MLDFDLAPILQLTAVQNRPARALELTSGACPAPLGLFRFGVVHAHGDRQDPDATGGPFPHLAGDGGRAVDGLVAEVESDDDHVGQNQRAQARVVGVAGAAVDEDVVVVAGAQALSQCFREAPAPCSR